MSPSVLNHVFLKKLALFLVVLFCIVFVGFVLNLQNIFKYSIHQDFYLKEGESPSTISKDFPFLQQILFKINVRQNPNVFKNIKVGYYIFSGDYTFDQLLKVFQNGPDSSYNKNYIRFKILEGWNIYDIDDYLVSNGFIKNGDYIKFVCNEENIKNYIDKYDFLKKVGKISCLEGFLYPDTYYIDPKLDFIEQLIFLQLESFDKKIYSKYIDQINNFAKKLYNDYKIKFDFIDIVTLASIIEKEEKQDVNKPDIAGVFFNRLSIGELIGADITLCYGLKTSYSNCSPSVILKHLYDKDNLYNTRQNRGLTPSPISNPSDVTIMSVLNYQKNNYFYYLHDNNGKIHFAENQNKHNINKNLYLK